MKNKLTTALLAFFLGTFGVHRFYLGQGGLGVAYLLFCWTGIPSLISFIDAILFLLMNDEAFDQKYNTIQYSLNMQQHILSQQQRHQTISANTAAQTPTPQPKTIDRTKEIQRLFELKQMGAITEAEYEAEKALLLNAQPQKPESKPEPPTEFLDNKPNNKDQDEPPFIQHLSPEDAW